MEIQPVRRSQLTEQVIERIKSYIDVNDLHPGMKLPAERDLAKSLGVSRTVTREAVRALEATGILNVQPGLGIFVSQFDLQILADHVGFAFKRQNQKLEHLIELRILFECGVIDLVVQRIDAGQIALLEALVQRLEQAKSIEEDLAADFEFHQHLLKITDNPLIMEFTTFLSRFFNEAIKIEGPIPHNAKKHRIDVHEHRAIVEALKQRDAATTKEVLEKSIRRWRPSVTPSLPPQSMH